MLKLLKFELFRKKTVFLVAALIVLLGQAYTIFKYFQLDVAYRRFESDTVFAIFASFLAVGFAILYLVDIITLLRQDMFKQEGYMLFMTPFNGYQILGAKVLFALIEGAVIAFIYFAIVLLNAKIMGMLDFKITWDFNFQESLLLLKILMFAVLAIMEFALTIFLSFALFKSIFTNVRFKGAITFGIFIVINLIKEQLFNLVADIVGKNLDMHYGYYHTDAEILTAISPAVNIGILYVLVMSAVLFIGTGYLLENKINL